MYKTSYLSLQKDITLQEQSKAVMKQCTDYAAHILLLK